MARILVIDDQPMIIKCVKTALTADGHNVATVSAGDLALKLLGSMPFDIIITDYAMPRMDGLEFLGIAKEKCPDVPIIMITGYGTADTAMEAMGKGAFDYLPKPFSLEDLRSTVRAANAYVTAARRASTLADATPEAFPYANVIAASPAMQKVCQQVAEVSKNLSPVLIQGEVGTGKELLARTIHAHSQKREGRFVTVNCKDLPLDATVRPFITDPGTGTVLFREVSKLTLGKQTELVGVLGVKSMQNAEAGPSHARVIASSSTPLENLVQGAKFRHDLLHHLRVEEITVPPLRERPEDIRVHIGRVLQQCKSTPTKASPINADALVILENYSWPGNVPELEETVRNAYTMARGGSISVVDLPPEIANASKGEQEKVKPKGGSEPNVNDFRGRIVKEFLDGREEEYKKLIDKIEGFSK